MNISVGRIIDMQTAITKVAVALKFTVHVVQSFIKGHRKSGVISIKHSRDELSHLEWTSFSTFVCHIIIEKLVVVRFNWLLFVSVPKCRDVVPGSTDRPTVDETESTCIYVKRHTRHAQHPQLTHTLPGAS